MRLNKYIATSTDFSRRMADTVIASGRVMVNGATATTGSQVELTDTVLLDGVKIVPRTTHTTLLLNKPVGYVCSRDGQGSRTVFELLPPQYQHLQPVGRLDKNSSGLLLLTDDGNLAQQLTHPRYAKTKVYEVLLDKPLAPLHQQIISDHGILLEDGVSRFQVTSTESRVMSQESRKEAAPLRGSKKVASGDITSTLDSCLLSLDSPSYEVRMQEGRNRQIRRTFAALGYTVVTLHRTHFGPYNLADTELGAWKNI